MTIVSNTSPISNLAKVGQLGLVQQLYGTVLIPNAVYEELLDERAGETVITAVQLAVWLEVHSVQNQELVNELRNRVNVGEAEALALIFNQVTTTCQTFDLLLTANAEVVCFIN